MTKNPGMMCRRTALLAVALVVCGGLGRADDRDVMGVKKLILIDKHFAAGKAKVAFVAKADPNIHNDAADGAPADLSGEVRVCPVGNPYNAAVFALGAPWRVNKATLSKYVNAAAGPGAGASGAKVVTVKPGNVLKVVGKALGDDDASWTDDGGTDLQLISGNPLSPPVGCTVAALDELNVEVALEDSNASDTPPGTPATHRICARVRVDQPPKVIAGGTGCKVLAKAAGTGSGFCGYCAGPETIRPLDHYRLYPAVGPDGPVANVTDQFEFSATADLGGVRFFLVPVDKEPDGLPIFDAFTHLTCYDSSAFPHLSPVPIVDIENQFGPQTLTIGDPQVLCVPTEKFPAEPGPPPPLPRDHFKCYSATGPARDQVVTLSDQFFGPDQVLVLEPFLFCNPADVDGRGILSADEHLTCYAYDPPGSVAVGEITYKDEFTAPAIANLDVREPTTLCAPSQFVGFTPPRCGDGVVNQAAEECDGGSDAACPGLCLPDCTCALPCGDAVSPACDGACPAGQTCLSFLSSTCGCAPNEPPFEGLCGELVGPPTCLGECPPTAPICGDVGGVCTCRTMPPPACGDAAFPECGGTCPSGSVCQGVRVVDLLGGGTFESCQCAQGTCTFVSETQCVFGLCAPGDVCEIRGTDVSGQLLCEDVGCVAVP